tara:strand:- start:435 stop:593 length:159 start_codon:yes stop_codon:yes gene_type:complete
VKVNIAQPLKAYDKGFLTNKDISPSRRSALLILFSFSAHTVCNKEFASHGLS